MEAVIVCMEAYGLNLFQWVELRVPFSSWEILKSTLIKRFRPSYKGFVFESMVELKQMGYVTEYREQFELLSTLINRRLIDRSVRGQHVV